MQVSMPCSRQFEPLAQGRPQAPLGQLVDQAVLFGQRHEARRGDRAELRVVPADQRLDPRQAAVAQRDLGLIDHVQAAVDRAPARSRRAGRASAVRSWHQRGLELG